MIKEYDLAIVESTPKNAAYDDVFYYDPDRDNLDELLRDHFTKVFQVSHGTVTVTVDRAVFTGTATGPHARVRFSLNEILLEGKR
ncbi:hypothetical protein [Saccharopolyspora shandongensis]|uniref:hypothetical protein n=1 Tax=Saccharopolyspora shandongensis TaxID=418495 RepID=UPI0033D1586E